jgi:hypothetical protein
MMMIARSDLFRIEQRAKWRDIPTGSIRGTGVILPELRHLIAGRPRRNAPDQSCGVYAEDLRRRWSPVAFDGISGT